MIRTQIYLTRSEAEGVAKIAANTGKKRSEVIREAIDAYLREEGERDKITRLQRARGLWDDEREFDLRSLREEFDREPPC